MGLFGPSVEEVLLRHENDNLKRENTRLKRQLHRTLKAWVGDLLARDHPPPATLGLHALLLDVSDEDILKEVREEHELNKKGF